MTKNCENLIRGNPNKHKSYCLVFKDFIECPENCPNFLQGEPWDEKLLREYDFLPYCRHIDIKRFNGKRIILCDKFSLVDPECSIICDTFPDREKSIEEILKQFIDKVEKLTN